MHDHYEYKVYRVNERGNEEEFFMRWCLPTAEACRKDFLARFADTWQSLRCIIRNSCGYVGVMEKAAGKLRFRHYPDTGWHVNV